MPGIIFNSLFVVGALLLALTAFLALRLPKRKEIREVCDGKIIGIYKNTTAGICDPGTVRVSPIVEYSVNGTRYELIGNYYNTKMQIGDSVKVLYKIGEPESATMKTGGILAPIITGAISFTFILISVLYFLISG